MNYRPINFDNEWLLDKHFPDIIREPRPDPTPYNGSILRCRASLEVFLAIWYRPKVTFYRKRVRDRRLGLDIAKVWRD